MEKEKLLSVFYMLKRLSMRPSVHWFAMAFQPFDRSRPNFAQNLRMSWPESLENTFLISILITCSLSKKNVYTRSIFNHFGQNQAL